MLPWTWWSVWLGDDMSQCSATWMNDSTQWMLIDWSLAAWRAISSDLEGHVLASVLPITSIDDWDENMESMLIKFADDIKRRERQPTQPNSKMISTGWNNSPNLTRKSIIGINGSSCTWVQKSNCVWGRKEMTKQQHLGKNLRDSTERGTVGVHHMMWRAKLPQHTRYIAMRAVSRVREEVMSPQQVQIRLYTHVVGIPKGHKKTQSWSRPKTPCGSRKLKSGRTDEENSGNEHFIQGALCRGDTKATPWKCLCLSSNILISCEVSRMSWCFLKCTSSGLNGAPRAPFQQILKITFVLFGFHSNAVHESE